MNLGLLKHLEKEQNQFEILIHLKLNLNDQVNIRNYSELNIANFKLYVVPVINLFKKQANLKKLIINNSNIL